MKNEIEKLEKQINTLTLKLTKLRKKWADRLAVPNYSFQTTTGTTDLASLFCGKDILFAIHNMGQGCRYCTLWADGLNGFLPHLEDKFSVVLLSKDPPGVQQRFAHSRGWRFGMASHGGGTYISEQNGLARRGERAGIGLLRARLREVFPKELHGVWPGRFVLQPLACPCAGGTRNGGLDSAVCLLETPGKVQDG